MAGDLIPDQIRQAITDNLRADYYLIGPDGTRRPAVLYDVPPGWRWPVPRWRTVRTAVHDAIHRFLFREEAEELDMWREHIC